MRQDRVSSNLQLTIIATCEKGLRRPLTAAEVNFVTSRGGYLALESIRDHVDGLASKPRELAAYLNSESPRPSQASTNCVP